MGRLEYANAVWECVYGYGEYQFSDGQDTVTLASICEDPPMYQRPEAGMMNMTTPTFYPVAKSRQASAVLAAIV